MISLFLSLFFIEFSFGNIDRLSNIPSPVIKGAPSVVRIVRLNNINKYTGAGVIIKNQKGKTAVVSAFSSLEKISNGGKEQIAIKYKGHIFPLNAVLGILPIPNLAFMDFGITLKDVSNPLKIQSISPSKKERSFYMIGFSSEGRLKIIPINNVSHLTERLGFISESTDFSGYIGGPILNEMGEVATIVNEHLFNYGFGSPSVYLRNFLDNHYKLCSGSSEFCIVKARERLYKEAKRGNPQAQHRLITNYPYTIKQYGKNQIIIHKLSLNETTENFMQSIGVNDSSDMKKEYFYWIKGAAGYYIEELYEYLILRQQPVLTQQPKEIDFFLKLLFNQSAVYPPALYLKGVVKYKGLFGVIPNIDEAHDAFKEAANQHFVPAYDGLAKVYKDLAERSFSMSPLFAYPERPEELLKKADIFSEKAASQKYYKCQTAFHIELSHY